MMYRLADVGSLGWNGDMPSHDLSENPLTWSSVRNMVFRAGLAERVQGYAAGFDTTPTAAPLGIFYAQKADGTAYVVTGTASAIYSYTGSTETDLTGGTAFTATADLKWSGGEFNSHLVITSHETAPKYIAVSNLSSATNFADLTNWPANTTCRVLRPFKYFLVAGNMTESSTQYPYRLRWSASVTEPNTLPSTWVGTSSNDAGYRELSATYGPIVDMLPLGDQLAVYRAHGISLVRWVGGQDAANRLVMAVTDVPSGAVTGILGLNCVADVAGLGHVVLSQSDAYIFDGTTTRSILDKRARKWLRENIDTTNAKRSFVFNNADKSQAWLCFPERGASYCTKAIVYGYDDNTLGIADLPSATTAVHCPVSEGSSLTWDGLSGTWDEIAQSSWDDFVNESKFRKTVICSSNNKLYVLGNSRDADGAAMVSQLERKHMPIGDAQRLKYFRAIWPRFDASDGQTFEITVGTSMSSDVEPTWGAPVTYTYQTSRAVYVSAKGRFLSLRIRSSGDPWRLRSLDVDVEPEGLY